jgi:putative peptidoglycan lipid II flippase
VLLETSQIRKNIQKASLLMVVSILLSRLIGFVREWVIAQSVGATSMTDVYYASFTIPDFLNYLMAAGALSITFIPVLSDFLESSRRDVAERVYRTLLTIMGSVLLVLVAVAEVFTEPLARWIAPGFSVEQTNELVFLLRIILPAQFFFYCGGLSMAVQQAHGQFKYAALAPLIYNGGIIVCGLALHSTLGIAGFSVGVLLGALFSHGVLQWIGVYRQGYSSWPLWDFAPEVLAAIRKYLWLTFPLMLGFSLVATDEWISKYFASQMESRAISWMAYARTEMRIPVAVIGQAAGMASFPYMSRLWAAGKTELYATTLLREMMKLWAAAPLAALLMYRFAEPITHFIYGGSRFLPEDLVNTAYALQMFSIGIFFWTAQVVLARGFYAAQMTWLPSAIGGVCSVIAIPLYQSLGKTMGFRGLALAGSLAIGLYSGTLWLLLVRHLRKVCPSVSLRPFYQFAGIWALALVLCLAIAEGIGSLGIYQHSRLSALAEVGLAFSLTSLVALALLRKAFARLTDGPLF